jgi:hypothetical protein
MIDPEASTAPAHRPGPPTSPSYEVKPADPEAERSQALAAWREGGLGASQAPETAQQRYDWFYLHNPQGRAQLNLLFTPEASLAGSLGIGCREFHIGARQAHAGVLIDFVVSPRHRSALPALTLQRKGREYALQSMDLVYGLPNPNALGICKRLATHVWLEFERLARVLRYCSYIERLMPKLLAAPAALIVDALDLLRIHARLLSSNARGEWVTGFDESFDTLWVELDKSDLCIGTRSRQFLQWRFREHPSNNYQIFAVRRKSDASLRMYFIVHRSGAVLSVDDCLGVGSDQELEHGVLLLCLAARRLGATSLDIHIAGATPLHRALLRTNFRVRDTRPFFAVIGQTLQAVASHCTWYITRADEDT